MGPATATRLSPSPPKKMPPRSLNLPSTTPSTSAGLCYASDTPPPVSSQPTFTLRPPACSSKTSLAARTRSGSYSLPGNDTSARSTFVSLFHRLCPSLLSFSSNFLCIVKDRKTHKYTDSGLVTFSNGIRAAEALHGLMKTGEAAKYSLDFPRRVQEPKKEEPAKLPSQAVQAQAFTELLDALAQDPNTARPPDWLNLSGIDLKK